MAVTITWDGNTSGLVKENDFSFYKISDRVFTAEELSGATLTYNGKKLTTDTVRIEDDGTGWLKVIDASYGIVAVTAPAGTYYNNGIAFDATEDGTWLVNRGGTEYVSSLVLPNATESAAPQYSHVTESSGDGFALYNGVKLPNILEWDISQYPYAVIYETLTPELVGFDLWGYELVCYSVEPNITDGSILIPGEHYRASSSIGFTNDEAVKEELEQEGAIIGEWSSFEYTHITSTSASYYGTIKWTNFNLLNTADNSVYLAASDPIPLDGMTVIEWDGVTDGLESLADMYYKLADFTSASSGVGVELYSGGSVVLEFCRVEGYDSDSWVLNLPESTDGRVAAFDDGMAAEAGFPTSGIWGLSDGSEIYTSLIAYTPASTEPEEPVDTTKKDFWNGVACGLCGSGTPNFSDTSPFGVGYITGCKLRALRERKPIAYLYNGVQLPALPEWDKEAYPYAVIEYYGENSGGGATANLYVFDIPAGKKTIQISSSYTATVIAASDGGTFNRMRAQLMSDGESVSSPAFGSVTNSNRTTVSPSDVLWANYDVPNYEDGGMLLVASAPVPVYE